jgi:hypothetical protein
MHDKAKEKMIWNLFHIFISNEIISHQIYGEMLSKCEHESKFSAFFLY